MKLNLNGIGSKNAGQQKTAKGSNDTHQGPIPTKLTLITSSSSSSLLIECEIGWNWIIKPTHHITVSSILYCNAKSKNDQLETGSIHNIYIIVISNLTDFAIKL